MTFKKPKHVVGYNIRFPYRYLLRLHTIDVKDEATTDHGTYK